MVEFVVILFHSTSHAIAAERAAKRAGLDVKLVPTPRELSSDCGSALRIAAVDRAACEEALKAAHVPIDRSEPLTD
ncbi:MAG: DUF3343 domain-containing protein [Planctomycetota bacterium]